MISKLQLQHQKEQIATQILAKGSIPTSHEIESQAQAFFETKTLGLPYYRPLKQLQGGLSNPIRYNQMFSELEDDLTIAYQANLENNHAAIELEENYLIERDRLDAKIQALKLRLNRAAQLSSQPVAHQTHSQTFQNFFDLDFNGNDKRNIPATTVFVDLNQRQALLDTLSTSSRKHDLTDSEVSFSASGDDLKEIGNLSSILKDTVNEAYSCTFTRPQDGALSSILTVTLKEPLKANHVKLEVASRKELVGILTLIKEDGSQEVLYSTAGYFSLNWSFDLASIAQMQFTLTKSLADGITETGAYLYRYLIRNLSLSKETYTSSATLVSKPFELNQIPLHLTIQAKEAIFNDTSIEYYLGLDNGVDKINWEYFENGVTGGFDISDTHLRIIGATHEEADSLYDASRHVYVAHQLPDDVLPDSVRLIPFYQKWKVESYPLHDDYVFSKEAITSTETDEEGNETEVTQIKETLTFDLFDLNFDEALLNLAGKPGMSHLDCDEYQTTLQANTLYIWTQYIEAETACHISDKFIRLQTEGSLKFRLFVNGAEIKPVGEMINLKLKAGRNKIQIVLFTPRKGITQTYDLLHNLNFKEVSANAYGETPLQVVDYHTLCNLPKWQEGANEFTSYALKGNQLLVRHRPSFFANDSQEFASTAYQLSYQTLKPSVKSALTQTLEGYKCQLRLMAILKSENPDYSPQLYHYQVLSS